MGDVLEGAGEQLVLGVPGDPTERGVDPQPAAVQPDECPADRRLGERGGDQTPGLVAVALGFALIGDVLRDAVGVGDTPRRVAARAAAAVDVTDRAVGTHDAVEHLDVLAGPQMGRQASQVIGMDEFPELLDRRGKAGRATVDATHLLAPPGPRRTGLPLPPADLGERLQVGDPSLVEPRLAGCTGFCHRRVHRPRRPRLEASSGREGVLLPSPQNAGSRARRRSGSTSGWRGR